MIAIQPRLRVLAPEILSRALYSLERLIQLIQSLPEGVDFGFHLWQPAEKCVQSLEFPQRAHRHAPVHFPSANNFSWQDTSFGTDHRSLLHASVISKTDLSADDSEIFDDGASRDSCLSGNNDPTPDLNVVGDLDQVVDLCSCANPCGAERASIDGGIRPHLYVILDHQLPHLRKLDLLAAVGNITETVASQHRPRVHNHPIAKLDAIVQDDAWIKYALLAEDTPIAHYHAGAQDSAFSYAGAGPYGDIGTDIDILGKSGMGRYDGSRMPQTLTGHAWGQKLRGSGEVKLRLVRNDSVPIRWNEVSRSDNASRRLAFQ
jgi:hypothetical protein